MQVVDEIVEDFKEAIETVQDLDEIMEDSEEVVETVQDLDDIDVEDFEEADECMFTPLNVLKFNI